MIAVIVGTVNAWQPVKQEATALKWRNRHDSTVKADFRAFAGLLIASITAVAS